MKTFNFSFPSQNAGECNALDSNLNEAAARELLLMMKSKQYLTILFFVKKDTGKPMILVQSPVVSKFSLVLTEEIFVKVLSYAERGEVPAEDFEDIETPIPFEGNTDELQETILRQWIEDGKTIQFQPTFRSCKLKGMLARRLGKVKFELNPSEEFEEFLKEHGYNV